MISVANKNTIPRPRSGLFKPGPKPQDSRKDLNIPIENSRPIYQYPGNKNHRTLRYANSGYALPLVNGTIRYVHNRSKLTNGQLIS